MINSGIKTSTFKKKDVYKYLDFTKYDGIEFIQNVFIGILEREVDIEGLEYYLKLLISGKKSKDEIITSIKYTHEGKTKNIKLIGSKKAYIKDTLIRLPIFGKIFKWIILIFSSPKYLKKRYILPKLAYLSPLSPQKSGISNYSAELIPYLKKYYRIDVITENLEEPDKNYNTKSIDWFINNYNKYDRVLYHFGNSKFHAYMITLLDKISGVVVLHDFYLSDLMLSTQILNQNFIYSEYGYRAVQEYEKIELTKILKHYPFNKKILNNALSIITHSKYSKELASHWYHKMPIESWHIIPHLQIPLKNNEKLINKKILNLPENSFIVSSFGQLSSFKINKKLFKAWIESSLYKNKNCYLIFVGEDTNSNYIKELKSYIDKKTLYSKRIIITDWVNTIKYKKYLSITDIAIQLRINSHGEILGTILDCMNYGIATIINANGSNQEIPKDCVYMLEDKFTISDLKMALELLYNNKLTRNFLTKNAKSYIIRNHSPKKCAKLYYKVIEESYQKQNRDIRNSINTLFKRVYDTETLIKTIYLSNFDRFRQKQILIDISSLVEKDLKTGIQRVVRSQIIELIKHAPINYRIEPIYLSKNNIEPTYYYARTYTTKLLNLKKLNLSDTPININHGDIFYGLDLCGNEVIKSVNIYRQYRALGVKISFMVYDLLPIIRPEFFPKGLNNTHTKWLETIIEVSDLIISISKSVENDIINWIKNHKNSKLNLITFKTLHLGADIYTKDIVKEKKYLDHKKSITFIMVGTIEPRKGHNQVLKAFEILWKIGVNVKLKIIGKKGWMMDNFIKKITQHPKLNKTLFYLGFIDDKKLNTIYNLADCIIIASEAEGFGLPLIESALHGLSIIARDIPVFREIAGSYAFYFKNNKNSKELAITIQEWLLLYKKDLHPKSNNMPYLTWEDNAKKLLEIL